MQRIQEQYKSIELTFRDIGDDERLPQRMEAALFRLVQEAVQNACKHASAKRVKVTLEIRNNFVVLMVKDDGVGFDPKQKREDAFGLIGMRERAEVLEGKMEIRSEPNQGATILIQIPLLKEELV